MQIISLVILMVVASVAFVTGHLTDGVVLFSAGMICEAIYNLKKPAK